MSFICYATFGKVYIYCTTFDIFIGLIGKAQSVWELICCLSFDLLWGN